MWTLGLKGLTRRVYFVKSTPVMESFILLDERNFKKIQVEVFDSILIFFNILLQENVSCLNTTLVFLMFGHRHGRLPAYLTVRYLWYLVATVESFGCHFCLCYSRAKKKKTIQRNYQLYFTEVVAHRFCI